MNLAFCLFNYFPFGGLERDFMAISQECISRGHSVNVFTMRWDGDKPPHMDLTIFPPHGLSSHRQVASYSTSVDKYLSTSAQHDLIVGFNRIPGLDIYYAADVCYENRIRKQRSFLSRLTPRYRLFSRYEKTIFSPESTTDIIYLSNNEKDIYQRTYGTLDERFHYAPPGVDKNWICSFLSSEHRQKIRSELQLRTNHIFLLMIGSNFLTKGVDRSIQAIASLPQHLQKLTFLFVIGKGDQKTLLRLAEQLDIRDNIHFLGGRDDVPRYLAGADLLLQPSRIENTGNAIVEALVTGVPVLATETCGYAEHVILAKAGKIIPSAPFKQEEMNSILKEMLISNNKKLMKKRALDYAAKVDLYNRPQVVTNLLEEIAYRKNI